MKPGLYYCGENLSVRLILYPFLPVFSDIPISSLTTSKASQPTQSDTKITPTSPSNNPEGNSGSATTATATTTTVDLSESATTPSSRTLSELQQQQTTTTPSPTAIVQDGIKALEEEVERYVKEAAPSENTAVPGVDENSAAIKVTSMEQPVDQVDETGRTDEKADQTEHGDELTKTVERVGTEIAIEGEKGLTTESGEINDTLNQISGEEVEVKPENKTVEDIPSFR